MVRRGTIYNCYRSQRVITALFLSSLILLRMRWSDHRGWQTHRFLDGYTRACSICLQRTLRWESHRVRFLQKFRHAHSDDGGGKSELLRKVITMDLLSWDNYTSISPMLFSVFRRKYNYFRLRNEEHGCKSYLSLIRPQKGIFCKRIGCLLKFNWASKNNK